MPITERTKKTVPLGSGHNYIFDYDGETLDIPAIIAKCTAENRYGTTTGGATLTYTAEKHTETDDLGYVQRTILTKEESKLKLGVFSWAPGMLEKLVATYRSEVKGNYRIHRIGGIDNDNGKKYIVVFEHVDKIYGNLYVIIVGTNTAGLSIAFAKDAVSKLEPEYTAEPNDDEGTQIIIAESLPATAQNSEG